MAAAGAKALALRTPCWRFDNGRHREMCCAHWRWRCDHHKRKCCRARVNAGATESACTGAMHPATSAGAAHSAGGGAEDTTALPLPMALALHAASATNSAGTVAMNSVTGAGRCARGWRRAPLALQAQLELAAMYSFPLAQKLRSGASAMILRHWAQVLRSRQELAGCTPTPVRAAVTA